MVMLLVVKASARHPRAALRLRLLMALDNVYVGKAE
jgi:hypothetical protein